MFDCIYSCVLFHSQTPQNTPMATKGLRIHWVTCDSIGMYLNPKYLTGPFAKKCLAIILYHSYCYVFMFDCINVSINVC